MYMKNNDDNEIIKQYGDRAKLILEILSSDKEKVIFQNEAKAFSEVYDIIMNMNYKLRRKIPNSFMEMVLKKRSRNLKINIDYTKNILEQITVETKVILAIIYKKYILNTNKNIVNQNIEKVKSTNEYQQEKVKNDNKEIAVVQYKKSNFFKRIFDKIKYWLKDER